eukprot:CAMPEP_0117442552 /NCGR_PEP_ID=MMETSP0759-20121206/4214_1 /TAXON_ID=63605 /ORGANISM="Percolomonas cosmopolitus, Strain WS" /LENGTH=501 /DNA_ID=CAMNT_0005234451 /DNA_START=678 /DNA_END=2183 /DNA_ORIENTATION=-
MPRDERDLGDIVAEGDAVRAPSTRSGGKNKYRSGGDHANPSSTLAWHTRIMPESLLRNIAIPLTRGAKKTAPENNDLLSSGVPPSSRSNLTKCLKIGLHVIPSYYILLTRSPMHLLMYNLVLYNALGPSGKYISPKARLCAIWRNEWMNVALCVVALLARLGMYHEMRRRAKRQERQRRRSSELGNASSNVNETSVDSLEMSMEETSMLTTDTSMDESMVSCTSTTTTTADTNSPPPQQPHSIWLQLLSFSRSNLPTFIFHTIPILLSLYNLAKLIRIHSQTRQSNELFSHVYRNPVIYYQWRDERVGIYQSMQSVGRHAAYRAALDAILVVTLLGRRVFSFLSTQRKFSWLFWRRRDSIEDDSEKKLISEGDSMKHAKHESATVHYDKVRTSQKYSKSSSHHHHHRRRHKSRRKKKSHRQRFSWKTLILRIKHVLRFLKILKYTSKPIHVLIFELFYHHVDWNLFLHGVAFMSHLLLYAKCQRMETWGARVGELVQQQQR